MKNFRKLIAGFILILTGLQSITSAQTLNRPYPMIGDTISNHTFTDLVNYPGKEASIKDFRGKWLILDFWGYSCSACLASFPKMDKLSQLFKDRVQIVMVGATKNGFGDTYKIEQTTKKLYKRLDSINHYKFTVAFDSVLYIKHDVGALPQIFVIDPNGVIYAKSITIDSIQLASLVSDGSPKFNYARSRHEVRGRDIYRTDLPMLTNGTPSNGGNDTAFLYRSLLSVFNKDSMDNARFYNFTTTRNKVEEKNATEIIASGRFEVMEYSLDDLFRMAYIGINNWEIYHPIREFYSKKVFYQIKDTAQLKRFEEKKYAYSLIVPRSKSSDSVLLQNLQQAIANYFGYSGRIVQKKIPVWYLEVDNSKKIDRLISSGGKYSHKSIGYKEGQEYKNTDIDRFIHMSLATRLWFQDPIIDATGLKGKKLNITFKANELDSNDIFRELKDVGFRLVKGEKDMKVVVVTDN